LKDLIATRCKAIQTLVGFKSKECDWLVLNSKQEGLRLVGFQYQKADDWLDSKFHCSYLESRGVAEEKPQEIRGENAGTTGKTRRKLSPFIFRSGDVISGDTTSGDVISDHFQ
jgi:hypothetical protein